MPIAGRLAPLQGLECWFQMFFIPWKGINMSAQGIALRHQDRFRIRSFFDPITMKNRQVLRATFQSVTIIIPCLAKRYILND